MKIVNMRSSTNVSGTSGWTKLLYLLCLIYTSRIFGLADGVANEGKS